jgi:hypothetical protein
VDLSEVFDIAAYTRNAGVVFTRLEALVAQKEEVQT